MKSYFKRNMENLKNGIEGRMSNAFNDVALATPASLMPLIAPLTVLTFVGIAMVISGCTEPSSVENGLTGIEDTLTTIAGGGTVDINTVIGGDNAIIGPGSVVAKDVPSDAYVSGNPARDLTKLSGFQSIINKQKNEFND